MKFTALHLLFCVVAFELIIGGAIVVNCLVRNDANCSEGKVQELFSSLAASSFAIYAAEKASSKK